MVPANPISKKKSPNASLKLGGSLEVSRHLFRCVVFEASLMIHHSAFQDMYEEMYILYIYSILYIHIQSWG